MIAAAVLFGWLSAGAHAAPPDSAHVEMEGILVSTTRSTRTIRDIPTRVEVIAGEELVEKGNMRPGDIRMLLNEMTGITIRQESSFLGESGIWMQGLDRRFTQVLKDGFPLHDGLSGGLGLLQTPPLDLEQVEIIKGPASTFHGSGAVAGLVNLVSRKPGDEPELRLLVNGTTAGGADASVLFLRPGLIASSTYVQGGWQRLYDPSDEGFAAIPRSSKAYLRQTLFAEPTESTDVRVIGTYSNDDRTGGAMRSDGYRIRAESQLASGQAVITHRSDAGSLQARLNWSRYSRIQTESNSLWGRYRDHQSNRFAELAWSSNVPGHDWVVGAAIQDSEYGRSPEDSRTVSLFANSVREIGPIVSLETGYRIDHVDPFGTQHLPRVSLMASPSLWQTYRLTGGMGYVLPTLYLDPTMRPDRYLSPGHVRSLRPERSLGGTADANYRTEWANLNVMGFLTRVENGLEWESEVFVDGMGPRLRNRRDVLMVGGFETNLKLDREPFALYLGHTFTDTKADLVSRHRFNSVLMIEEEDEWRIGLEAYYHGRQNVGNPYVIAGIMADRRFGPATVFANLENVFDVRQTRHSRVYQPIGDPGTMYATVAPLYAPLDGRIFNMGARFEL